MNLFRTPVEIPESGNKLRYQANSLFIGSCFTLNIGEKIQKFKFPAAVNPFGVLYNPVSVSNGVRILLNKTLFSEKDLHYYAGKWLSFFHDTSFSGKNSEEVLRQINNSIATQHDQLKKATFLFISLGTAWVYRHKQTGLIVSNNHKIPAREFERFRLTIEDMVQQFGPLLKNLFQFNPDLHIVFTVSPVRHWKDGAIENQKSKSTLLLGIDEIQKRHPQIEYFPSYEIMMDELRDYRFYASDMIHPGITGIEYIWQRFQDTYMDPETIQIMRQVEKVVKATQHRPTDIQSKEFQRFAEKQIQNIHNLHQTYPFLNFSDELAYFKAQME